MRPLCLGGKEARALDPALSGEEDGDGACACCVVAVYKDRQCIGHKKKKNGTDALRVGFGLRGFFLLGDDGATRNAFVAHLNLHFGHHNTGTRVEDFEDKPGRFMRGESVALPRFFVLAGSFHSQTQRINAALRIRAVFA